MERVKCHCWQLIVCGKEERGAWRVVSALGGWVDGDGFSQDTVLFIKKF